MDDHFSSKLADRRAAGDAGAKAACPINDVIQAITGKWVLFLMVALAERPHRFGELRRLLPDISQRMLTQTLHDLRRDGHVHREVLLTTPPSVAYSLTPLGRSLFEPLRALLRWAELNHTAVHEARAAFDAAAPEPVY
jgi:DNA-binding HxlR family transcriptional regulator